MPELPFPDPPSQKSHPRPGGDPGVERTRPVSPPNVWLCAERHGGSVLGPLWARRVIRALSERNERVIVRALRGYPGLAVDAAALLRVAGATGRLPVALMPTPCLAARTRTLLRTPHPDGTDQPGTPAATEPRPVIGDIVASAGSMATQQRVATDPTLGLPGMGGLAADGQPTVTGGHAATGGYAGDAQPAVTDECAVTGHPAVSGEFPVTAGSAATSWPGAAGVAGWAVPAIVGVGRRRAGVEHGPAAVVIVLAGPVTADARLPRRTMPSARVLGRWARVLEPGGVLAVLSPPPVGRHRAPGGRWEGSPVPGLAEVGLSWADHIVLIHAPTTGDGLDHPDLPRRPELPFLQVHTCLDLFENDAADPTDPVDPVRSPDPVDPADPGVTR
jgi:hypothetical protein